ncbi:MAG: class IV adenylate cyclase [Thermococci archaeon]|nr:class IV adenylate cyclase [Thermococci archaeon]
MEIEVKFRVDFEAMRRKIEELGAGFVREEIQEDVYFNVPLPNLLRVRKVENLGKAFLTYKLIEDPGRNEEFDEIEVEVSDFDDTVEILRRLGYKEDVIVRKRRLVYKLGRVTFELSDVEGLGGFLDIEVMGDDVSEAKELIWETASRLGLGREDVEPRLYRELLRGVKVGRLPMGKLRNDALERLILPYTGREDARVIQGPRAGFDAAVVDYGSDYLVVATDPTLDVPQGTIGFFAYHFAASDVAVFGADPVWLVVDVLLPPDSDEELLGSITSALHKECLRYGGTIIGGHTGVYRALRGPVVTTTVIGTVKREDLKLPVARPGDAIVVTDKVGLEFAVTAAYLDESLEDALGSEAVKTLRELYVEETSVPDALTARALVRGMHDATEGGLTALHEVADGSNLGFVVFRERIPVREVVREVLELYGVDPLTASSSGTLIAITPPENVEELLDRFEKAGIGAAEVGRFTDDGRRILMEEGRGKAFPEFVEDPYVRLTEVGGTWIENQKG